LVGKLQGKEELRKPWHIRVDNIKVDVRYYGVVRTGLISFRLGISGRLF
jgi:hypothetical protein